MTIPSAIAGRPAPRRPVEQDGGGGPFPREARLPCFRVGERTRFAPALFRDTARVASFTRSPATSPDAFLDALEKDCGAGGYDVVLAMDIRHPGPDRPEPSSPRGDGAFPLRVRGPRRIRVQDKGELASFASAHASSAPHVPSGRAGVRFTRWLRFSIPPSHQAQAFLRGRGIVRVETPPNSGTSTRTCMPSSVSDPPECLPPGAGGIGVGVLMNFSSEPRAAFAYRRLREYPVGGGPSTLRESVRDETLCRATERLLSALGWTGVAMAEFKVDPRTAGRSSSR